MSLLSVKPGKGSVSLGKVVIGQSVLKGAQMPSQYGGLSLLRVTKALKNDSRHMQEVMAVYGKGDTAGPKTLGQRPKFNVHRESLGRFREPKPISKLHLHDYASVDASPGRYQIQQREAANRAREALRNA